MYEMNQIRSHGELYEFMTVAVKSNLMFSSIICFSSCKKQLGLLIKCFFPSIAK